MIKQISHKEFIEFNRVLSLLLISKIPIISALELVSKNTSNERLTGVIKQLVKDIKGGSSLSKSCEKHPKIFSDMYVANIRVAEETGRIAEIITDQTAYEEKFFTLKRKIVQAARYPLFVLIVAILVVTFMLMFLIPTFTSLFRSVETEIPPLTAAIIDLSDMLIANGHFIALAAAGIISLIIIGSKNKKLKSNLIDPLMVSLPLVKGLYVKNLLARFSLSMSVQLKSGITLLEALKISKNISPNSLFKNEINSIIKKLVKGQGLALNTNDSKFFDITYTKLLSAGEESAELEKVFELISDYYTKEFDYRLENLTALMEPLLIILIASIVAVILVAMYLPMFEIINYIGV